MDYPLEGPLAGCILAHRAAQAVTARPNDPGAMMRGIDEDTGEYLGPSRSQQRREALEVRTLGKKLVALSPAQLDRLPIPDDLLPHILDTQRIDSRIARKRQLQFLAKQMRRQDEGTLHAIRDALDAGGEAARQETALLHRIEAWRERRSEEHTSELQSRGHLVCRLLLEKK